MTAKCRETAGQYGVITFVFLENQYVKPNSASMLLELTLADPAAFDDTVELA